MTWSIGPNKLQFKFEGGKKIYSLKIRCIHLKFWTGGTFDKLGGNVQSDGDTRIIFESPLHSAKKNYNILLYIVFFLPNISPNFFLLLRPAASRLFQRSRFLSFPQNQKQENQDWSANLETCRTSHFREFGQTNSEPVFGFFPSAFVFFSGHVFVPCKLISLVRLSWILLTIFLINEGKLFQLSVSLCLWRVPVSLCCKTKQNRKCPEYFPLSNNLHWPSSRSYRTTTALSQNGHLNLWRFAVCYGHSFVVSLSVLPWSVSLVVYFYQLCLILSSYSFVGVVCRALFDFFQR